MKIEADVKKIIRGDAVSYIEDKKRIVIPFNRSEKIKSKDQAWQVANRKVSEINEKYNSPVFGAVVSIDDSLANGVGINIHVPSRLLDAYEKKYGTQTELQFNKLSRTETKDKIEDLEYKKYQILEQFNKGEIDKDSYAYSEVLPEIEVELEHLKGTISNNTEENLIREKLLPEGQPTDVKSILERIANLTTEDTQSRNNLDLAKFLLQHLDKNRTIKFVEHDMDFNDPLNVSVLGSLSGTHMYWDPFNNSVNIGTNSFRSFPRFVSSFLHEVVHSFTMYPIYKHKKGEALQPYEKRYIAEMEVLYKKAFQMSDKEDWYYFTNLQEFITGMLTDPAFISHVRNLDNRNWFEKFIDTILRFFGIKNYEGNGIHTETKNLFKEFMSNLDKVNPERNLEKQFNVVLPVDDEFDFPIDDFEFEDGFYDDDYFTTKQAIDPILKKYIKAWKDRYKELEKTAKTDFTTRKELQRRMAFITSNIKMLLERNSYATLVDIAFKQLKSIEKILSKDDVTAEDINETTILIDGIAEIDQDLPKDTPGLQALRIKAIELKNLWTKKNVDIITKIANERTSIDTNTMFNPVEDIGKLKAQFLSTEDTDIPLVKILHAVLEDRKDFIRLENAAFEAEKSKLITDNNFKKGDFKKFIDPDTGHLITPIKSEYYAKEKEMLRKRYPDPIENADGTLTYPKPEISDIELANWFRDNNDYELTKEGLELYNAEKEGFIESLDEDDPNRDRYIHDWEQQNDPKIWMEFINGGTFNPENKKGHRFTTPTPKEQWLDPRYDAVKDDPVYKFFVEKMVEAQKRLPHRVLMDIGSFDKFLHEMIFDLTKDGKLINIQGLGKIINDWYSISLSEHEVRGINKNITDKSGIDKPKIRVFEPGDFEGDPMDILDKFYKHSISYKYTTEAEPITWLLAEALKKQDALRKNRAGVIETDEEGFKVEKGGLKNAQLQFLHRIQADIYGQTKTPAESKITKEDIVKYNHKLAEWKKNGEKGSKPVLKKVSATKIADTAINYTRLKLLGLNPFSAIGNILIGLESNFLYAARNKDFNDKALFKAIKTLSSSMVSFYTGKKKVTKTASKVANLMIKFGVVSEGAFEGQDELPDKVTKVMYLLQSSGEYLIQGQTMLAMLYHKKIKDKTGKERSLFEAFNSDGSWNKAEFGSVPEWESISHIQDGKNVSKLREFTNDLRKVKHRIHGNYEDSIKFKSEWYGRAVMIFRTWLPKAVHERFGEQRGTEFKGRYRSYAELFRKGKFAHTMGFLLGETVAKLPFIYHLGGKKLAREYENFLKENKNLSDLDIQNLRVNIREIQFILGSYILMLALKGLAGDGEDDDFNMLVYLINQSQRLDQELWFFYSPKQAQQILKDIIPLYKTYGDVQDVVYAGLNLVEDPQSDIYKRGFRTGKSKFMKEFGETVPFYRAIQSTWSTGHQVFGNESYRVN